MSLQTFQRKSRNYFRRSLRATRLHMQVRHVHGPAAFDARNGPVIVCLVKNGTYYLDAFFDHYRRIGIRNFVFIDNNSDDDTVERIASEPNTAVLRTSLPVGRFENLLREKAARQYASNGWVLFADTDEIIDFKGSDLIGIDGLVSYLDTYGYTGLVAQMLEMFPGGSLRDYNSLPYKGVIETFDRYDISTIRRLHYHDPNSHLASLLSTNAVQDEDMRIMYGGVRERFFAEPCFLTKHPLVKVTDRIVPGRQPHLSTGLRVADITGLIRHYKFANDPVARDADTAGAGTWTHGEDRRRLERFRAEPDLSMMTPEARQWRGVDALIEERFLKSSANYERWLAARLS